MVQANGGNAPDRRGGMSGEHSRTFEGFRRRADAEPVLFPGLQSIPRGAVGVDAVPDPDKRTAFDSLGEVLAVQPVLDAVAGQEERWKVGYVPKMPVARPVRQMRLPPCGKLPAPPSTRTIAIDAHPLWRSRNAGRVREYARRPPRDGTVVEPVETRFRQAQPPGPSLTPSATSAYPERTVGK